MSKFYTTGLVFMIINIVFYNVYASAYSISKKNRSIKKLGSFDETLKRNGYLGEKHFVITKDGYVLGVNRIIGGPISRPEPKKPIVLLLHGLIASSDIWLLRGPKKDLAYLLVDEGFDVWLLNFRGNTYSRRHLTISPKDPEFWKFSWHESGVTDLPDTIDYINSHTGVSKMSLVGYSMGTTVSYVLLSQRPEYNKKIDVVISLAPVAIFTGVDRGLLSMVLPYWGKIKKLFQRTGTHELLPNDQPFTQIAPEVCNQTIVQPICNGILLRASGSPSYEQFDKSIIPALLTYYPAGTSINSIDHYYQNIVTESFRLFDFGVAENYARYGSSIPPEYPLERITAPVILYYGVNDRFVQPTDVRALEERLPNAVIKVLQYPFFNHFDFIISKNTKELLYDDVINVIKDHKSKEYFSVN